MSIDQNHSFRYFVFRQHRRSFLLALLLSLCQAIIYKVYYPHLIFNYDGYHYIDAAVDKMSIYYWPIGYSIILRLMHALSHSEWLVFIFQFLLLQSSLLYLYFTLKYLLRPGVWVSRIILLLFVVNPIIVMISNYVLSDAIFNALTLYWLSITLWYLYKPRAILIYSMAVLLFILFAIRYYAIFYPAFTVIIVLFSRISWRARLGGLGFGCVLFSLFIWHTSHEYKKLLGYPMFSPFAGWALAQNALIMYRSFHNFSDDIPDSSLRPLHGFVTAQLKDMQQYSPMPDAPLYYYYMWMERGPLRRYMAFRYKDDSTTPAFKKFSSMAKEYEAYGKFLIRRHPGAYIRYYLFQNLEWYIMPVPELENEMHDGKYFAGSKAQNWFGYRSGTLTYTPNKIFTAPLYQILMNIMNILFLFGCIGYYFCGCYRAQRPLVNKIVRLSAFFWLANFLFVLASAPVMMRYGIACMFINTGLGLIFLEYIFNHDRMSVGKLISPSNTVRHAH